MNEKTRTKLLEQLKKHIYESNIGAIEEDEILDNILSDIKYMCSPDEVFEDGTLAEWAVENGFNTGKDN